MTGEGFAMFCWCRLKWPQYMYEPGTELMEALKTVWRGVR